MARIMSPVVWATGGAGMAGPGKAGNPMVCAARAGAARETEHRRSARITRRRWGTVPVRLRGAVRLRIGCSPLLKRPKRFSQRRSELMECQEMSLMAEFGDRMVQDR